MRGLFLCRILSFRVRHFVIPSGARDPSLLLGRQPECHSERSEESVFLTAFTAHAYDVILYKGVSMTLSVCLIVKDEQEVIARCLDCALKFADEIIIVDTGSADGTVEECRKFTDKIYFYEWNDDFSAARNVAFGKAACEYVMWLDADDVVTESSCAKIREMIKGEPTFDMAFLPYAAAFDGDRATFVYYRERIMRRSMNFMFEGAVHEAVTPRGNIVYGDAEIQHRKVKESATMRNLHILQKMIARGICLNEREKFYYGRELLFNGMYCESIAVLEDFLKGDGWVENKIEACVNLCRAYLSLGKKDAAYAALLKSFIYAPPRCEACCILGGKFFEENDLLSAVFWYERALGCSYDNKSGGFVNYDFCAFIPCMQLCVLYDRLGDYEKANEFNERAGKIKPDDKNYLNNKKYFEKRLGKEV